MDFQSIAKEAKAEEVSFIILYLLYCFNILIFRGVFWEKPSLAFWKQFKSYILLY